MFLRLARCLLLLLAVLGMMPGVEELVEELAEQIAHGHPAHSSPHEPDLFCAEQDCGPCSGPACACHAVPSAVAENTKVDWLSPSWLTFIEASANSQPPRPRHPDRPALRFDFPAPGPPTPPPNV
ncbi:MAG TPA: hypothetical protein PLA94_31845 [Myxococcota bacterium]|nr:hypothetical protein [Myxococcota bacterium]